ncbi:signal peptidase II [candidate division NPL-UPA2 bacterium]|nr:signal peptidase II [candidate division NPL-UPA2 bacterium]
MAIILTVSGLLLLIDQVSKHYIERLLFPICGQSISLIENLFQLTLVHNPGGAFGLLRGAGPLFFIIASVLTIILLLLFWKSFSAKDFGGRLSLGLIIGGASGNLIDRLRFGHVIDFFDLSLRGYHWPVFNFADMGISIGVIILCYKILKSEKTS